MVETNAWVGLMEETQQALAELRTEDLEALALRAQLAFAEARASGAPRSACDLRVLAARHRILGEVLEATERNLQVLRRLRGDSGQGRGALRWVR